MTPLYQKQSDLFTEKIVTKSLYSINAFTFSSHFMKGKLLLCWNRNTGELTFIPRSISDSLLKQTIIIINLIYLTIFVNLFGLGTASSQSKCCKKVYLYPLVKFCTLLIIVQCTQFSQRSLQQVLKDPAILVCVFPTLGKILPRFRKTHIMARSQQSLKHGKISTFLARYRQPCHNLAEI